MLASNRDRWKMLDSPPPKILKIIKESSMENDGSQWLRISTAKQTDGLTPAQKKFNTLTRRIDRQRKLIAQWEELIPTYQEAVLKTFEPLRDIFTGLQAQMVEMLDNHYFNYKFSRLQKENISHIITEICVELIYDHGREDLKPIANRHSDIDFDDQQEHLHAMGGDVLRAMLEEEFDLDPDELDLDMNDPYGTSERLRSILDEQQRKAEEQRPKRKKTARQLAKDQFEKEQESKISQSIRAIYRQLVGALHPDREQDPEEHQRKTDLMQKVTVAYRKGDLLQLLELQLAVEQIDQDAIDSMNEDRLTYFNRTLQRQSLELRQEIDEVELRMRVAGGLAPFELITPKKLMSTLKKDKKQLETAISDMQKELSLFGDIPAFKRWLKNYELPDEMSDDLLYPYFEDDPG
ncbi:MAG: hypothetical protein ACI9BW_002258 [Gammaproteobacteria bacterium]|jgi:hypothetical protein